MKWLKVLLLVVLGAIVWATSRSDDLDQYEVTLGDGTKATCIVARGYRNAGVACIPHVVLGPDAGP